MAHREYLIDRMVKTIEPDDRDIEASHFGPLRAAVPLGAKLDSHVRRNSHQLSPVPAGAVAIPPRRRRRRLASIGRAAREGSIATLPL